MQWAAAPPEILPIIGSRAPFGYRNQAKLVLRRTRAAVLAGLYVPGSHRVVDARACAVHHPSINRVVAATVALLDRGAASIYDERSRRGALRYLVVRHSVWQRQTQIVFVAAEQPPGLGALVRALRRRCRGVASVVLNLNASPGNVIFGPRWIALGGADAIVERMGGLRLQARAGSFIQANPWIAGRLYRTIERWVGGSGSESAVDLYAGIGAIALTLAPRMRRVYAIEESEIAAGDARSNARRNGIGNLRVLARPVEQALPELRRGLGAEGADVVTMNPPRSGVSAEALAEVVALHPRAVAYLSCDLTSLARDLARLAAHGYRTVRVQPADMLPQTEHVECLALAVAQETRCSP
jgi:23S rRNA (uracil1939-C5)-methyltransferase